MENQSKVWGRGPFECKECGFIRAPAESVAYLCCTLLGLDNVAESRGYIQTWLGNDDIPETSARRIFKVTNDILKAGQEVRA